MSREEIIAMAKEAGFRAGNLALSAGGSAPFIAPTHATSCLVELDRFADLVAAKEREECAQVCESRVTPGTGSVAILGGAADAIRARGKPFA